MIAVSALFLLFIVNAISGNYAHQATKYDKLAIEKKCIKPNYWRRISKLMSFLELCTFKKKFHMASQFLVVVL